MLFYLIRKGGRENMKCRFMCLSLFVTSFFDIYESIRIYTKYKKQRETESIEERNIDILK